MQSLEVISVNIWHILISLCNLVIIFLIVRKLLFKPVQKALDKRQGEIDRTYSDAEDMRSAAMEEKAAYDEKLSRADETAGQIIRDAEKAAESQSDKIISKARDTARGMVRQAEDEIEADRVKADDAIRKEIVDLSAELAGQILKREVKAEDHRELIDSFLNELDSIGDDNDDS